MSSRVTSTTRLSAVDNAIFNNIMRNNFERNVTWKDEWRTYISSQQWSGRGIRFPEERKLIRTAGVFMSGYGNSPDMENKWFVWLETSHQPLPCLGATWTVNGTCLSPQEEFVFSHEISLIGPKFTSHLIIRMLSLPRCAGHCFEWCTIDPKWPFLNYRVIARSRIKIYCFRSFFSLPN